MSIIIGLTGPTGAGKSSASAEAVKLGFKVIDCDKLARIAVEKGTKGLAAIVSAFGNGILNTDGTLNRKALAQKAFSTPQSTELLNKTLLPFIAELIQSEIANEPKVLLDAPTLFESGINKICNITIAVLADKNIRFLRITERDGIDSEAALLRINAGKNDEFYRQKADYIIYNNGENKAFILEFNKIITEISGKI